MTERVRVTSIGNVGVGSNSPGVRLVNSGATNATTPTFGSGTVGADAILSANGLYGLYTGVADAGHVWQQVQRNDGSTAVYPLVLQPSGGNVGIGTTNPLFKTDSRDSLIVSNTDPTTNFSSSTGAFYIRGAVAYASGPNPIVVYPSLWRQQLENIGFFSGNSDLAWALSANGGAYSTEMILKTDGLSIKASDVGNEASHVPIFISDPSSTVSQIYAKPLLNFKFDVGSFIAKGVRTNSGDWSRTLDSVNDYGLWQSNFDWLSSYYDTRIIIEAQTTGNINSTNTADKQLTIGWGISTDTDFNGETYCTVNVPLGTGVVDYNVIINGTITITSTSELKMVLRVQIASGNSIEQNVMRMANVTTSAAMLNAAKKIAFTGKMNVTGTHTWNQRQTYLRLN
jgi:hypothetical protein